MIKKIPGRLFTFGCSYTRYHYPTWADILGQHWEFYENWGKPAAGNQFIFNSVIECDQRHSFTSEDTVLILWSAHGRHDYYQLDKWLHSRNAWPDKIGQKPFNCPKGYEIVTYAMIHALHEYLSYKKINFKSMRWTTWDADGEVVKLYKKAFDAVKPIEFMMNTRVYDAFVDESNVLDQCIKNLYNLLSGVDWPDLENILARNFTIEDEFILNEIDEFYQSIEFEKKLYTQRMSKTEKIDRHPLPTQHLNTVRKIFPEIEICPTVIEWLTDIEKKILNNQIISFDGSFPVRL